MSEIIVLTTIGLCALYLLLITAFSIGLFRKPIQTQTGYPSVAVIIPARNEETNIDACLQALSEQTYPSEHLEIITVNDQSSDDTPNRIQNWARSIPNLQMVSVEQQDYVCPKKNALWQGIKNSQSEIILTTDADCRPGPNWVASTIRQFAPQVGMVISHAPLHANGMSSLLELQSLIVSTLAAGSAGMGFPLTGTGRNLAYRRKAFDDVNGFEHIGHIIGGDDVLLLRKIATQSDWKIYFNAAPEAAVPSAPHHNNLIHRQVRYQSKAIHYGIPILILASAVYILHSILLALPVLVWIDSELFLPLGQCLALKVIADAVFLFLGASKFQSKKLLWWFPLLEIVLIPYIVIVCALGAIVPFKWK